MHCPATLSDRLFAVPGGVSIRTVDEPEPGPGEVVLGSSAGTQDDVERLIDLIEAGEFTPVVDREYPLAETGQAFQDLADASMVGNLVVTP